MYIFLWPTIQSILLRRKHKEEYKTKKIGKIKTHIHQLNKRYIDKIYKKNKNKRIT